MEMMKYLILTYDNSNAFFPKKEKNAIFKPIFNRKFDNIISRIQKKLYLYFSFSYVLNKWFSDWINEIKNVDSIIIFDNGNADYILKYIHKLYPDKRLILWYWNTVSRTISPRKVDQSYVELWSFDREDCKKYNMRYNTQFFFKSNLSNVQIVTHPKTDVSFIGTDKSQSRINIVHKLEKLFKAIHIKSNFYIVKSDIGDNKSKIKYRKPLSYNELLNLVENSKCILDITNKDQVGLSLRPLEAVFLKRKLITDSTTIKKYKIYDPKNVFILGEDNIDDLTNFIKRPYIVDDQIKKENHYEFNHWIERFNIKK